MGILKKHGDDNWYQNIYADFEKRLEAGHISLKTLRTWDCYGSRCPTCDDPVTAFKFKGGRYDLVVVDGWCFIHQCPPPVEDVYPDDPNVRDGSGEIRSAGFFDDYPDDPYSYPDIPYVDPTRNF